MLDEKLVELKDIKKGDDNEDPNKAIESEFQIVENEEFDKEEAIFSNNPSKYYEFAMKEDTNKYLRMIFQWMLETEIEMREAAGMKFGIIAAVIFGIIGALKVEFFYEISFMNYLFLQCLVSLGILYLMCRKFDVLPFLENEEINNRLKIGAGCTLIGIVMYLSSWNYWPRELSHLLLCCIPLAENLREGMNSGYKKQELGLLFINLLGFIILLTIFGKDFEFQLRGFITALIAVLLFYTAFQQLKKLGPSNVVSIGLINTLVFSIFLPGFFGVVTAKPPNFGELFLILLYGIPTTAGIILMIRCVQITKPSHALLAASVALAIVLWVRTLNMAQLSIQGLIGVSLSAGCAVIILYQQQDKTAIMSYMTKEPLTK